MRTEARLQASLLHLQCSNVRLMSQLEMDEAQWRIQNFIMGGWKVEGDGSGEGAVPPPRKKMKFYLKQVGFGAF